MASQQVPRRQRTEPALPDEAIPAPVQPAVGEELEHLQEHQEEEQATVAAAAAGTTRPERPARTVSIDTSDVTCWICYTTQQEDPSQRFIHPCACTLVAHPDCLLEWLATQQATATTAANRIPHCPACGTAIRIHQDRSRFLRLYRNFRRQVDRASLAAGLGTVGASAWFVAAAYGAWALKTFMGDQLTQTLLLRHENGLPWRYWLNLPLIPISLVLSRTPLIDSLLPFLPLTLVLSTHTHPPLFDPVGIDDLSLHWPPSPTLTVCLLPWLRLVYLRTRHKVFRAVLGRRKQFRGLAGVFEEAAMDEMAGMDEAEEEEEAPGADMVGIVATFEVEPEEERRGGDRAAGGDEEQQRPQAPAQEHAAEEEEARERPVAANLANGGDSVRLRAGLGRLTSLVLGALLFPALSSLAGSAFFWLAARGGPFPTAKPIRLLRRLLGVSALLAASASSPSSSGTSRVSGWGSAASPTGTGWVRALLYASRLRSADPSSVIVDPKWVRNSLGAGVVLLMRDAVELVVGVLENRRKRSRRIVERPFRPRTTAAGDSAAAARGSGAEILQGAEEGDGARRDAQPAPGAAWSGGRDQHDRPAVVHNYL